MNQQPYDTRIQFALQIYDTATPRPSLRQIEKIAGIKHPSLLQALALRALKDHMRCPTCGRVPGEKISLRRAHKERQGKENLA
jgi:transposase-like protein